MVPLAPVITGEDRPRHDRSRTGSTLALRVLLTRAAADSARTRDTLLADQRHEVALSPVIEIIALEASWPDGIVEAVLATSANAFDVLDDSFGPPPERTSADAAGPGRRADRSRAPERTATPALPTSRRTLMLRCRHAFKARWPASRRDLVYLAGRRPQAGHRDGAVEVADHHAFGRSRSTRLVPPRRCPMAATNADPRPEDRRRAALSRGAARRIFGNLASAERPRYFEACDTSALSEDVGAPLHERGLPRVEVAGAAERGCVDGVAHPISADVADQSKVREAKATQVAPGLLSPVGGRRLRNGLTRLLSRRDNANRACERGRELGERCKAARDVARAASFLALLLADAAPLRALTASSRASSAADLGGDDGPLPLRLDVRLDEPPPAHGPLP